MSTRFISNTPKHCSMKESGFTEAAIAGLAAKEDFSSIKLKRSDSSNKNAGLYPPYKELMLMQIKGRRYCQTRLVEPAVEMLNNGDCFILINGARAFLWIGEHANVIEKAKANEIFDWIKFKKDLGLNRSTCAASFVLIDNKTTPIVDLLDEIFKYSSSVPSTSNDSDDDYDDDSYYDHLANKYDEEAYDKLTSAAQCVQEFLMALGLNRANLRALIKSIKQQSNECLDANDEKFETLISETNMIYRVSGATTRDAAAVSSSDTNDDYDEQDESDETMDELKMRGHRLEPVKSCWGQVLSYNMLDEDEVFVFDFGTELYVWNGRNANNGKKKIGMMLAKELYETGYDYSEHAITPLKPSMSLFNKCKSLSAQQFDFIKTTSCRPKWTILGKQSQNCETILFIEKTINTHRVRARSTRPRRCQRPASKSKAAPSSIVKRRARRQPRTAAV